MVLVTIVICLLVRYVQAVTVRVEQGMLRGEQLLTVTRDATYYSFKGIPYAEPPVGRLRFQAPQPAAPWNGIRNATQHGNRCMQLDIFTGEFILDGEDCLFLNVYSPNLKPDLPLEVLIFIHGGVFQSGSGNDDLYGPDFFMSQGVILVTINYRLGVFGFLSLESKEVAGNAGMKDQVAAMKWVQRNIAQFGGNPKKVTIIGHSAGSYSCFLHAISPMSKGLFYRAIAMSGSPLLEAFLDYKPQRRAKELGNILGYETNNITALFEFFLAVRADRLLNTKPIILIAEEYINNFVKMYNFLPVVEKNFGQERFLLESPITSIKNGRIDDVEFIIGYQNEEGSLGVTEYEASLINDYNRYPEVLTPREIWYRRNSTTILNLSDEIKEYYFGSQPISINTMPEAVRYFTATFVYQILRYTRDLSIVNKKTIFVYQFSAVTERNVYAVDGLKYGIIGAGHLDILMYLFQANQYNIPIDPKSTSYRIIKQITTLFANFAKYGNPTPDASLGVTWELYDATTQNYLDIGAQLVPRTKPEADMMIFWKSIYKQANFPFYYIQNN